MTEPSRKPSRLDLVRSGRSFDLPRTGRFVVSIDKVVENPRNERKIFRNMEGLMASVRAVGLVEPITVMALEDGGYKIVTGHRRYRAARAAGLSQIEVLIREPEDERARRRKSLVSNIQCEEIGPVELAEALQEQLDEDSDVHSQAELAAAIGKDNYIETVERFNREVPPILDGTLRRLPRVLAPASRGKGTGSRRASQILVPLPVRVSTAPSAEEGVVEVRAVFTAGREAWPHQLTHELTVTAAKVVALGLRWSVARPFRDAEWFTTDNPVLRLNYYGEGRSPEYELRGGWGNKGTEIMLPLPQPTYSTQRSATERRKSSPSAVSTPCSSSGSSPRMLSARSTRAFRIVVPRCFGRG